MLASREDFETAFEVLAEAVESGFSDAEQLQSDPAFQSRREETRFKELIAKMSSGAIEAARVRVRDQLARAVDFPFSFTLKDADGRSMSLSDYKGKVVLVDFWGTWCGPCLQSIPHLVRLQERFADRGFSVVALTYEKVDPDEAPKAVKAFLEQAKLPYHCLIGDEETQAQVPGFQGFPTTLILDRSGKIRYRSVGFQPTDAQTMEDVVRVLLEEPVPTTGETKTTTPPQ